MKRKPKFEYRGEQFLTVLKTKLMFSHKTDEYDSIEIDVEYCIQDYTLKINSIVVDELTIPETYTKDDVSDLVEFVRSEIGNGNIQLPMYLSLQQKDKKFECHYMDSVSEFV
jgi:hypothetical protein